MKCVTNVRDGDRVAVVGQPGAQSSSLSFMVPGRVLIHRNCWTSSFQMRVIALSFVTKDVGLALGARKLV